ncbi:MAG: hypothetical protein EOP02_00915 [Proteobacteria bacterium]|nr:MAG: hypothetical protein EOP02_00915 [Pseudomonadota bacterium]
MLDMRWTSDQPIRWLGMMCVRGPTHAVLSLQNPVHDRPGIELYCPDLGYESHIGNDERDLEAIDQFEVQRRRPKVENASRIKLQECFFITNKKFGNNFLVIFLQRDKLPHDVGYKPTNVEGKLLVHKSRTSLFVMLWPQRMAFRFSWWFSHRDSVVFHLICFRRSFVLRLPFWRFLLQ